MKKLPKYNSTREIPQVGPGRPRGLSELPNFQHFGTSLSELSANSSQTSIILYRGEKMINFFLQVGMLNNQNVFYLGCIQPIQHSNCEEIIE